MPASSLDHNSAFIVHRPRESDAIGAALRDAFSKDGIPEDMQALLRRIDCPHNGR